MRTGNVRLLRAALDTHRAVFVAWGVHLLLEKVVLLAYRTLFKRACVRRAFVAVGCFF